MKKLPSLTAVIEKEGKWYVATCLELGVASQGRTLKSVIHFSGLDISVFMK